MLLFLSKGKFLVCENYCKPQEQTVIFFLSLMLQFLAQRMLSLYGLDIPVRLNEVLHIFTRCLLLIPTDHLPIFSGVPHLNFAE